MYGFLYLKWEQFSSIFESFFLFYFIFGDFFFLVGGMMAEGRYL